MKTLDIVNGTCARVLASISVKSRIKLSVVRTGSLFSSVNTKNTGTPRPRNEPMLLSVMVCTVAKKERGMEASLAA